MKLTARVGIAGLVVALTAGLAAPVAVAGPVAERRAAYKPTLKASDTKVIAGKKLVLSGKVRPATKGGVVILQKRLGTSKKWQKEARLKVGKKGTYRYTDRPNRAGVRSYRVVVPKFGKIKAGTSKPVKVTVYTWRSLADTPFRQNESTQVIYDGDIAGTRYAPAFGAESGAVQGKADWNVDPSCTTLRVRLGNGDQSDLGAHASITLDGGPGEFTYTKSYGLTESEAKTFDIKGVFRLTYTWQSMAAGSAEPSLGAQPLLAVPELLCATD